MRLAIFKVSQSINPEKKHSEFFKKIIINPLIKRVHYDSITEFVNEHRLTTDRRKKIAEILAKNNIPINLSQTEADFLTFDASNNKKEFIKYFSTIVGDDNNANH